MTFTNCSCQLGPWPHCSPPHSGCDLKAGCAGWGFNLAARTWPASACQQYQRCWPGTAASTQSCAEADIIQPLRSLPQTRKHNQCAVSTERSCAPSPNRDTAFAGAAPDLGQSRSRDGFPAISTSRVYCCVPRITRATAAPARSSRWRSCSLGSV